MMTYQTVLPGLSGARATHFTSGSDHLYYATEAGVYWLPLNPAIVIANQSDTLVRNKNINLNKAVGADIQWSSDGTKLLAKPTSRILPLPNVTSLAMVSAEELMALDWTGPNGNFVPENGGVGERFYAVRMSYEFNSTYHYAKVRVSRSADPTNTTVRINWVTYHTSPNPRSVATGYVDVRDIVLPEDESVLYFTADGGDGNHYVMQAPRVTNTSNPYPEFSSADFYPIHLEPLVDPRQMVLEDGFIYVVDLNGLWRIDPVEGKQVKVVSVPDATGLLLSREDGGLTAYISTNLGDVFTVELFDFDFSAANAQPLTVSTPEYRLGGASGSLSWANASRTAFYAPLLDARVIKRVDLASEVMATEVQALASTLTPWSVEVITESKLYVATDKEIGRLARSIGAQGELLLGIGLIPFDYINNSKNPPATPMPDDGKATTDPNYYFGGHPNLPFGGMLSLMLNHEVAWNSGYRFYSVKLRHLESGQERLITDSFYDNRWQAYNDPPRFLTERIEASNGMFPVKDPADLWYLPYLAAWVHTRYEDNGHNLLIVEFFDGERRPVANGAHPRLIMLDNTYCRSRLELPRIGTATTAPAANVYPELLCGCLAYTTKNDLVEVDYKAWHPEGSGTFSLNFWRGGHHLPNLTVNGPVTTSPVLKTKKEELTSVPLRVGHILGNCDVANVEIHVSVPARVIDGFQWVNLGAHSYRTFTLIKGPITHTPWP